MCWVAIECWCFVGVTVGWWYADVGDWVGVIARFSVGLAVALNPSLSLHRWFVMDYMLVL